MRKPANNTLMIQGTMSNAGKTTLVAGLCRILARRGINVAPFKPQNMALNSAVTLDGGEIGRAQALQALACGLEPHTDMNPVLLKPNSDIGAQVIINGHVVANMDAGDYHAYKTQAMPAVLSAFERLQQRHDFILVEGAGSPAEINLRDRDIANMGFAEAVDCPVALVGDIDRGGVFAQLTGTLSLLSESEQRRVTGLIINLFRGDINLLHDGVQWLEEATGKPVFGVVPFIQGLHLDAEDAFHNTNQHSGNAADLQVVVPVLPHISNHTDLDPLLTHPQLSVHLVGPDRPKPPADLVILPGSKNVISDLCWFRDQGWDRYLQKHLRYGGKLLGICGGFQMLGQRIDDPLGMENGPGSEAGLGLLDMHTVLENEKQLRHVQGRLWLGEAGISGYEIHMGQCHGPALERPAIRLNDRYDGAVSEDGQIMGTYLHGLFDQASACEALLRWAGVAAPEACDHHDFRLKQLDRLADTLEETVNIRSLFSGLID